MYVSKGTQAHQPLPKFRKEVRFRFWLCLQLAVTLHKTFDLSGVLFPTLGRIHVLQGPSSLSTILPS